MVVAHRQVCEGGLNRLMCKFNINPTLWQVGSQDWEALLQPSDTSLGTSCRLVLLRIGSPDSERKLWPRFCEEFSNSSLCIRMHQNRRTCWWNSTLLQVLVDLRVNRILVFPNDDVTHIVCGQVHNNQNLKVLLVLHVVKNFPFPFEPTEIRLKLSRQTFGCPSAVLKSWMLSGAFTASWVMGSMTLSSMISKSTSSDFETGHKHDSDCCEPSAKPERANLWSIQSSSKLLHGCKSTHGHPQKHETSIMVAPSLCFKEKLSGVCKKYHPDWHKRVLKVCCAESYRPKHASWPFSKLAATLVFLFSDTSMDAD